MSNYCFREYCKTFKEMPDEGLVDIAFKYEKGIRIARENMGFLERIVDVISPLRFVEVEGRIIHRNAYLAAVIILNERAKIKNKPTILTNAEK